jgi:protoporphyrinogen oxidase
MVIEGVANEAIGVDVAIVGGGPAGLSTCIELARSSRDLKIVLLESEEELGGLPRSCRGFFWFRSQKRKNKPPPYE